MKTKKRSTKKRVSKKRSKSKRGFRRRRATKSRNRRVRLSARRHTLPRRAYESIKQLVGGSVRTYRPGEHVKAVNSIYEGARGVVVRDIGTGIEWRITSNSLVKYPEYAPVGQVVSVRKAYMAPA